MKEDSPNKSTARGLLDALVIPDGGYRVIYADPPWDGLGWNNGSGNYTRANSELCLLGTKGHCQKMRKSRSVR